MHYLRFLAERVVKASVRFTAIEWNDKLSEKKSEEFATTSKKITTAVRYLEYKWPFERVSSLHLHTDGSKIIVVNMNNLYIMYIGTNERTIS